MTLREPDALLEIDALRLRFGGVVALDGVSFSVNAAEICGLIGPNGAGKTSLFNCISRLYTPDAGSIRWRGRAIDSVPRHKLARLGIARTFQNLALFAGMNVRETVMLGAHVASRGGFLANALRLPLARAQERRIGEIADALLDEFGLRPHAGRAIAELPFATRKRVELARALAAAPKLLMLDEPAAGLNREEVDALAREIQGLRDRRGVAVLLVEHHMGRVMRISDRVVALDFGRCIAEGTPAEVRADPETLRAYLGDLH